MFTALSQPKRSRLRKVPGDWVRHAFGVAPKGMPWLRRFRRRSPDPRLAWPELLPTQYAARGSAREPSAAALPNDWWN